MDLGELRGLEDATDRQVLMWLAMRADDQVKATAEIKEQLASATSRMATIDTACKVSGLMNGKINRLVTWRQMRLILAVLVMLLTGVIAIDGSRVAPVLSTVAKVAP